MKTIRKQRPVNLNLFTIKFPITAIISILHRISGVIVFLLIPLFLWMLSSSLSSPLQFDYLQDTLSDPFFKFIVWIVLTALFYHLAAGIRHLVMDLGWGESLLAGRRSAAAVLVITVILALFAGVWLW